MNSSRKQHVQGGESPAALDIVQNGGGIVVASLTNFKPEGYAL
jgi:hypothetical protein